MKEIASEGGHWYDAITGDPVYEVPYSDPRKGMKATTLADARKLNLVPSVTTITREAAAPGLVKYKVRSAIESALTLPKLPDETADAYAVRVLADSEEHGRKARERGTELHTAIEEYIKGSTDNKLITLWYNHLELLDKTLEFHGIDIHKGKAEHCFASKLGYGGKLDWHNDEVLIDFKTKDNVNAKVLAYPEHIWQLAAYDMGIGGMPRRLLNVFIGCDDCAVRIHEWTPEDRAWGQQCFAALLQFWKLRNKFGIVPPSYG